MSTDPVDDDTELLHQGFPVEEIVGGDEEIPEEVEDDKLTKEEEKDEEETAADQDRERNQGRLSIL